MLIIRGAAVIASDGIVPEATVVVDGGVIAALGADPGLRRPGAEVVDGRGLLLGPGLIDLHLHGLREHLVDRGPDDLRAIARLLPRHGVTGWLPTLAPQAAGRDEDLLRRLAAAADGDGARVLGFHLEGPYLALAGALPPEALAGADQARAERLVRAASPRRVAFSVSPEFPAMAGLVAAMRQAGALVFMTHTAAGVAATEAAIAAGASHATHFYDVFPCPCEEEPGVRPCGAVEAILADPRVTVDFILDGVHVHPVAVRLALACKGPDGVCLISDAMVGAGLPCGIHSFGGRRVVFGVEGGPARLLGADGAPGGLAGSGLTLDRAVRNAVALLGADLPLAMRLASASPAAVLGLAQRKGRVAVGCDADLVLWNRDLQVERCWVGGRTAYDRKADGP